MTAILKMLGSGDGAEFALGATPVTLGRDAACEIVLDDPSVSKRHAQILLVDGEFILRDQNSHNGTFVGDERITHKVLNSGDIVAIGPYKMLFVAVEEQPGEGEIVLARGDVGEASIAVASEVRRMDREINEKIRQLEDIEEKGRRNWSRILTVAIVVAALIGLVVLLRMNSDETRRVEGVDLDRNYSQLVRIPWPMDLSKGYVECLDPETLAPSGLLEIECLVYYRGPDEGAVDGARTYDRELGEICDWHCFARVRPTDEGRALLRITGENGVVYFMVVNVADRPNHEWPELAMYKKQYEEGHDVGALEALIDRARSARDANPAMALEAVRIVNGLAGAAGHVAELTDIEEKARQNLNARWEKIRLELLAEFRLNRYNKITVALKDLLALVPDEKDERNQWARILLKMYER